MVFNVVLPEEEEDEEKYGYDEKSGNVCEHK